MEVKISSGQISGIGRIVHFHRKQSRLSRVDLADIAGVGKTVIFDIEHGKESVKINTLLRVTEALSISLYPDSPLMSVYEKENRNPEG